eukprot:754171-Hanusia_phi.AAC.5
MSVGELVLTACEGECGNPRTELPDAVALGCNSWAQHSLQSEETVGKREEEEEKEERRRRRSEGGGGGAKEEERRRGGWWLW